MKPTPAARVAPLFEPLEGRRLLAGDGLLAQYFDNDDFTSLKATRVDPGVDFDWEGVGPAAGVDADTFSVRWSGFVEPQFSETYRFTTRADDGVRLWVNGVRVIDDWETHAAEDRSGTVALAAGQKYELQLEYFQGGGGASARLSWGSPSRPQQVIPADRLYSTAPAGTVLGAGTGTGLRGDYFDNRDFSALKLTRVDATIDYDWGLGSPASGIGADTFSTRWTGQVQPRSSGTYTFFTSMDDGVRLWVNDVLIVDDFVEHPPTTQSGTINLTAGQKYDVRIDHYENGGGAAAKLEWAGPGVARQVVPKSQLYPAPVTAGPNEPEPGGDGLRGEYFDDGDLAVPVLTRVDGTVDFDWGLGSPNAAINPEHFSARWTGRVLPATTEAYTFRTDNDNGTRLWVDGRLIINDWTTHAPAPRFGTVQLTAGVPADIKLEFYEDGGGAAAKLSWSTPTRALEVVPRSRLFSSDAPTTPPPLPPSRGTVGLAAGFYDVSEQAGQVVVRVNRTGGTQGIARLDYTTVDGTATSGIDYEPVAGVLTIPDGADHGEIVVPIVDNGIRDGGRAFSVGSLTPGSSAARGGGLNRRVVRAGGRTGPAAGRTLGPPPPRCPARHPAPPTAPCELRAAGRLPRDDAAAGGGGRRPQDPVSPVHLRRDGLPYKLVLKPKRPGGDVGVCEGEITVARPTIVRPGSLGPKFRGFFPDDDDDGPSFDPGHGFDDGYPNTRGNPQSSRDGASRDGSGEDDWDGAFGDGDEGERVVRFFMARGVKFGDLSVGHRRLRRGRSARTVRGVVDELKAEIVDEDDRTGILVAPHAPGRRSPGAVRRGVYS